MLSNLNSGHIVVTGGAGFMGSSFIRYVLGKEGFAGQVTNLDSLTYAGSRANVASAQADPRYRFVHGDIRDAGVLETLGPIDLIVHFAAESHVDRSIEGPQIFLETNVLGTCQLLEYVKKYPKTHFHHISTDEVYGALGKEGTFTETSPYRPNSPYSASKASADHFVRAYGVTYGISTTLSHASNNYGPCQYREKLIPLIIERARQKEPLPVYGKGENVREWLYVDDHSAAIWTILERGISGEAYNIPGSVEMRNIDLIHLVLQLMNEDGNIAYVKDRPGHDFRYAMEGEKIRALGWTPKWTIEKGLEETISWTYENRLCHSR